MFTKIMLGLLLTIQVSVLFGCSIDRDRTQHFMQLLHSAAPYYQTSNIVQRMYPYAISQLGNAFYECSQTSNVQMAFQVFNEMHQFVITHPINQYSTIWDQCKDIPVATAVNPSMPRMLSMVFQQHQSMQPVTSLNYWQTFMNGNQAIVPQQCLNLGSTLMSSLMACHNTGCYDIVPSAGDHVHVHMHHHHVSDIALPAVVHTIGHHHHHDMHTIVHHVEHHHDGGFLAQVLGHLTDNLDDYDVHSYRSDADSLQRDLMDAIDGHNHAHVITHTVFHG